MSQWQIKSWKRELGRDVQSRGKSIWIEGVGTSPEFERCIDAYDWMKTQADLLTYEQTHNHTTN